MKEKKKPEDITAEQWLDDLFNNPGSADEIGADHHAMDSVGLHAPGLDMDHSGSLPAAEPLPEVPAFERAGSLEPSEPFMDDEFQDTFGAGNGLAQIIDEVKRESNVARDTDITSAPTAQVVIGVPPASPQPPQQTAPQMSEPPCPAPQTPSMTQTMPAVEDVPEPTPVPVKPQPGGQTPAKKEQADADPKASKGSSPEADRKKGRPKRKKGYGLFGLPHLVSTAIWLVLILVIGVTAGRMLWLCATDVLAFGREPITATVVISEEDTMADVGKKLQDAGLIRFSGLFEFYADLTNAQEDIRPGTYEFNALDKDSELVVYDYMALVSVMSPSSGLEVVDDLRIPEGYTCAQIFQLLEENNVCTVEELEQYCIDGELDEYWFLEGVERGDRYCLEGYLFPNTYDFYENDDPKRVLEKMLDAFDANFTDQMRDDLNLLNTQLEEMMRSHGYGDDYINSHRVTIREAVIIASMIEKETANNVESFTIASVIYNRLTNAGEYPFLNIDATLVYALDGKAELTEEDKKLDSPYNTYLYKGLTPGPISNPSQNSLAAALQPETTDYHYYAYNPSTGEHKFSATYEEHLQFLEDLKAGQVTEADTDE